MQQYQSAWLASYSWVFNHRENLLVSHHSCHGRAGNLPLQQVSKEKLQKLQKLTPDTSTVKQFTTSTVSTSLVSSTEPIALATFPKVVICNKYQLRYAFTRHCCVLMIEKVFNRLNLLFNNSNLKEIIHGLFGCKFEHYAKRSKQLHRR